MSRNDSSFHLCKNVIIARLQPRAYFGLYLRLSPCVLCLVFSWKVTFVFSVATLTCNITLILWGWAIADSSKLIGILVLHCSSLVVCDLHLVIIILLMNTLSLVIATTVKSVEMRCCRLVLAMLVLLSSVKMTFGTELKSNLLKVEFMINFNVVS